MKFVCLFIDENNISEKPQWDLYFYKVSYSTYANRDCKGNGEKRSAKIDSEVR